MLYFPRPSGVRRQHVLLVIGVVAAMVLPIVINAGTTPLTLMTSTSPSRTGATAISGGQVGGSVVADGSMGITTPAATAARMPTATATAGQVATSASTAAAARSTATATTGGVATSAPTAAAVPPTAAVPPQPLPPGFVGRSGTRFTIGGRPFTFTGFNIYQANSRSNCSYTMGTGSALDTALTDIGPGTEVFRAWFFQRLATTNGQRDWSAFDHTLAVARAHGVRVIVTLANQWGSCESPTSIYKTDV